MINSGQQKAIETTEGPVLIIAGPGTGKTFTLVKRIARLITDMHIAPNEIMAVTFTEKAARELITRVSDELSGLACDVNVNEMYIGTFHAVALRLLKENSRSVPGKIIDSFETAYLVCRNMDRFEYLGGFKEHFPPSMGRWRRSLKICEIAGRLREELCDVKKMAADTDNDVQLLCKILSAYNTLLRKNDLLDFSAIQTCVYEMLRSDRECLEKLQRQIKYIMVDEYQDTNFVQEQLIFLLGGERQNICVVGDDDQGMYRFRGATIRNILEFPDKFPEGKCAKIHLDVNYRSKADIINFYSRFMENADGINLFNWDKFRFEKHIVSGREDVENDTPGVFYCGGSDGYVQRLKLLRMINKLSEEGYISDLNQIAFLFRSVKSGEALELCDFLEENGIAGYSPRSEMFFKRTEVKQIIGCLIMCFGSYLTDLKRNSFKRPVHEGLRNYYKACVGEAAQLFKTNIGLHEAIKKEFDEISEIRGKSEKDLLRIFYRIIAFEPFKAYLKASPDEGASAVRAARNLSEISHMLSGFMGLHNMQFLSDDNKIDCPEQFFNEYLKYLYIDGIGEYEDISEYAPKGCISFMTIHQAKGLEFPVTVVCSLGGKPRDDSDILIQKAEKYFSRTPYEPFADIKYFDFWRLYYTAFSRARDMLVLSERTVRKGIFSEYTSALPDISEANLMGEKASAVRTVKYKNVYSFTSHIAMYEDCPLQYKFYKQFGFAPPKMPHTSIGSIVHETLEEINNTAISGNAHTLNEEKIKEIYSVHLADILAKTGYSLTGEQQENALGHVLRYYRNRKDELRFAYSAEEEINLVLDKFILQGIVDLLEYYEDENVFEIVDYKTGPKPDISADPHSLDHYRKQLEIYAFLIEKRFKKPVRRMKLYYTGVTMGDPYIVFDFDRKKIETTVNDISHTIENIEAKNFEFLCRNNYTCKFCGMKYFCNKM